MRGDRNDVTIEHDGRKFHVMALLVSAVQNAMRLHPRRSCWFAVSEVFGIGSTSAAALCNLLGFDPDTGERKPPV